MAKEFTGLIGDEAGLSWSQPRITGQGKAVEDIASLSNKGFGIVVHDHHSGTLAAVAPAFGTWQGRR